MEVGSYTQKYEGLIIHQFSIAQFFLKERAFFIRDIETVV